MLAHLAQQPCVLLMAHVQQLLPQLFKVCRTSCQTFDNLYALYLMVHLSDAVKFISHAVLAPKDPYVIAWSTANISMAYVLPLQPQVSSGDPSATISSSNPTLQSRILYLPLSTTSQLVMRLLALCTRRARTLIVLGFIGTRTPRF